MKRETSLTKFLLNMIIVLIISLFGFNLLRHTKFYRNTDQKVYSFFSMVRYSLFEYPVETFTNFSQDYLSFWERRSENDELRQYVVNIADWELKEKTYLEEIEKLKALNELDSTYAEYELISGRVVDRSFESWNKVVTINIGSKDGVKVDDGVIVADGLVGKIIAVNENDSLVSLLSSNDEFSKISVVIMSEKEKVNGVIKNYDFETQMFDIQLMDANDKIKKGDVIVTSGLGGHFPRGLYFGKVGEIKPVADGVGISVKAKSDVNFNGIDYVKVVKVP